MKTWSAHFESNPSFLLPTDFSAGADKAFLYALSLASLFEADLHLLHVVIRPEANALLPEFPSLDDYCFHQETAAMYHLRRLAEVARGKSVRAQPFVRCSPNAVASILDHAAQHPIGLTLMGTCSHHDGTSAPLGRTVERVLRGVPGPVLTVASTVSSLPGMVKSVLVPVDFSAEARHAADLGRAIAQRLNARLALLYVQEQARQRVFYRGQVTEVAMKDVLPTDAAHQALRKLAGTSSDPQGRVSTHVVEGNPADAIVRTARSQAAHLIVQGAHGQTNIDHLVLGQVAESVIRMAPCPVITVKHLHHEQGGRRAHLISPVYPH